MKVWQIATGEPGRDYRELFFDHDMMILGPGDRGNALENNYADGIPNSAGSQVHSFAHKPKPGDRVIMRFAHDVIGIGRIPRADEPLYSFVEAFRCVYGWDLCHCRRVIWAEQYDLGDLANVFHRAKQKPSFTQVHEGHIVEMIHAVDDSHFDRPLKEIPSIDASTYTEETLGVELFRAGISNKNIDDILKALQQAGRLCSWYWSEHCGRSPSENEIVSHIVLPLFLGLGWSHQQMAVEWNRVDIAFFKNTPTTEDNCVMVLEAKGLGRALSEVLKQPQGYVNDLKLKNARYILTTDGANLFVYGKSGDRWNSNPVGYISVSSLQKEYVLPKGTNLVDTLVTLQPSLV
jgi:hypothetical protein